MKKVYRLTISEFMNQGLVIETASSKVINHLKRNQSFYIQASGYFVAFLIVGLEAQANADTTTSVIDHKARSIYHRICSIGKWIIVIKGGVDIIGAMSNGDLDSMKKKFIQYVVGYIALLALPWALDQAEPLFDQTQATFVPSSDAP